MLLLFVPAGWYCPACDFKNSGVLFPRCEACDNTLDPSGHDLVKELKAKLKVIMRDTWGDQVREGQSQVDRRRALVGQGTSGPADANSNESSDGVLHVADVDWAAVGRRGCERVCWEMSGNPVWCSWPHRCWLVLLWGCADGP